MNPSLLKKVLPHVIAILIFLIVSVVYCKPALDGKVLHQADVLGYKGMVQQSNEYKEKNGHYPLWTESTFSGMPTYNIAVSYKSKISLGYLGYVLTLGLPKPINFFYLACICMYILMVVLRVDPWIGVLTSLAYAWCSFDPVIVVVGHETEMLAIAYAPGVLAGQLLIFKRSYLWGAALLTIFAAFQIGTQHLQVVYYTVMSMGLLAIAYLVKSFQEKKLKDAAIGLLITGAATGIGFATYAAILLPVQEYSKETMRGGRTELTDNSNKTESKDGLSKDYAFGYSYGLGETFTLMVPHMFGGGSDGKVIGDHSNMADKLTEELNVPEDTGLQYANGLAYWGAQDGTSGTVYVGAIICLLFIFGAIYVKGWLKWWLVGVAGLGILLAWGKNFPSVNYFLFEHFPYYNKFRAPTIALVLPQFAFPVLGALGLQELLFGAGAKAAGIAGETWKKFRMAVFIMGGFFVLLAGYYFSADYKGPGDAAFKQNIMNGKAQQLSRGAQPMAEVRQQATTSANNVMKGLQEDRQSIFGSDLVRSFLLVAAAVLLIGLYLKGKFRQKEILLGGLIVLSSYDLLAVGRRYLNEDTFVEATEVENSLAPTNADLQILKDPEPGFRVFNQGGAPFASSLESNRTSYYHNSVGGYHPAKLGLYMDIIDHQLEKGNMRVYDMLNVKYFIQEDPTTRQEVARINPGAYGPCWLVKAIDYVKDGDAEMKALDSVNTRDTAIIQEKYRPLVKSEPVPDTAASIRLVANHNDTVSYQFSSKTNQFAVFSEVYYAEGWKAFLDGNAADYCRVNYILRGMSVPAGDHRIEFRFEPHSYELGSTVTVWTSIVGWLLLLAAVGRSWTRRGTWAGPDKRNKTA